MSARRPWGRHSRFDRGRALLVTVAKATDPPWLGRVLREGGKALQDVLVDSQRCAYHPGNVMRLDGPGASLKMVDTELERLVEEARQGDTVIFYFAGHGKRELNNGAMALSLCLHGGQLLSPSALQAKLDSLAERLVGGKLVIILDCCWAGALNLPAPPLPGAASPPAIQILFEPIERGGGRVVLAAVSADQQAMVPARRPQSLMTGFLVDGLRGQAGGALSGRLGSCVIEVLSWMRWLNGWSRRLQDRGWGTVRVFELFEFVSRQVEREAHRQGLAIHTVVLKADVRRNFALALRLPSLWLCLLILAVLAAALALLYCPEVELGLRGPPVATLGAQVLIEVRADRCVGGELGLVARAAAGGGWYLIGTRRITTAGVYPFAFEPATETLQGEDSYQLRAVLSQQALPPGPFSLPPTAGRWRRLLIRLAQVAGVDPPPPASISPPTELRLGAIEILSINGQDRAAAQPSQAVPALASVAGVAHNLEGQRVELRIRAPGASAVESRRVALVEGGRWQVASVPLRDAYAWHPQDVALEARIELVGVEPFVSAAWNLRLEPPRAWIIAAADWTRGEQDCRLPPWSSFEIRGRALHVLPGEEACVAILGEGKTTQTGLWCRRAEIDPGGRWETRIEIADGERFQLFAAVCARCPDRRGLATLGTAQLCRAKGSGR